LTALLLALLPKSIAVEHTAVLALVRLILCELCLAGIRKIPFTCSYLPGKSNFNMTFLLICAWLIFLPIGKAAQMEREILQKPLAFSSLLLALTALALLARWRTWRLANRNEDAAEFEEIADPAIFSLHLHRDGITPPAAPSSDPPSTRAAPEPRSTAIQPSPARPPADESR
jgi:hypothetical protein